MTRPTAHPSCSDATPEGLRTEGTPRSSPSLLQTQDFARLGQPVITAHIKASPADFVVHERLLEAPNGEGEHVYLQVEKRNANTAWVAKRIAELAGVPLQDVGYGGRKDRRAVTTQWFSCRLAGKGAPDWQRIEGDGVTLVAVTRHGRKLRLGEIVGNDFEITLRPVAKLTDADMAALETRWQEVCARGFPNYFGEQRFGRLSGQGIDSVRGNLLWADKLLREGKRVRHKRDIYLSAARAWLFNIYLSGRVAGGERLDGDGPLYGMSRDPQPGELDLPEMYRQWIAGPRQLRVKAGTRTLLAFPDNPQLSFEQPRKSGQEAAVQLRFSLAPGVFATSLLRELARFAGDGD